MADDPNMPRPDETLSPQELLRRQALADKRNQAMETMSNTIRKQDEARKGIIDKMR